LLAEVSAIVVPGSVGVGVGGVDGDGVGLGDDLPVVIRAEVVVGEASIGEAGKGEVIVVGAQRHKAKSHRANLRPPRRLR